MKINNNNKMQRFFVIIFAIIFAIAGVYAQQQVFEGSPGGEFSSGSGSGSYAYCTNVVF